MTGILKAILFLIPAFALSIFASFFVRIRLEDWRSPAESTSNAIIVSLLTLLTFAASMWLCSKVAVWWIKRQKQEDDQ